MRFNMWQLLPLVMGLVGPLTAKVQQSLEDDGKVDIGEAIDLVLTILPSMLQSLGLAFDMHQSKALQAATRMIAELPAITVDGKITASEIVKLGRVLADEFGFDFDDEGLIEY